MVSNDPVAQENIDTSTPMRKQIDEFFSFVDEQKTAILTTCRQDERLVSRPMNVKRENGIDFWLFTNNQSHKLEELQHCNNVNLSFYKDMNGDWASISGKSEIVNDREKIKQLYSSSLKAWFPDQGDGVNDGSENDPRITLILVKPLTIHVQLASENVVSQVIDIAKSTITGKAPRIANLRQYDEKDLEAVRRFETAK